MTLATTGPDGPWAADVFFAERGLRELYFISSPKSRHAQDLLHSNAVAATVHPEPGDWRSIRGLQLSGDAHAVDESETAAARAMYTRKFPFAEPLLGPDSEIAAKTSSNRFYVLHVRKLFLIDNSLGFGTRQEIATGD
jgi:uncharacterized protein YhbP (UPF0306 family)